MALFGEKDSRPAYYFNHIDGIPSFAVWQPIKVIFDYQRKELIIGDKNMDNINRLKLDQIINVGIVKSQDITYSQQGSVVKNAVAGGLLFGSVGAIVGGMSGMQKKSAKKNVDCFVINYRPQSSQYETRVIAFEIPAGSLAGSYLWENLRPYCKKASPSSSGGYL